MNSKIFQADSKTISLDYAQDKISILNYLSELIRENFIFKFLNPINWLISFFRWGAQLKSYHQAINKNLGKQSNLLLSTLGLILWGTSMVVSLMGFIMGTAIAAYAFAIIGVISGCLYTLNDFSQAAWQYFKGSRHAIMPIEKEQYLYQAKKHLLAAAVNACLTTCCVFLSLLSVTQPWIFIGIMVASVTIGIITRLGIQLSHDTKKEEILKNQSHKKTTNIESEKLQLLIDIKNKISKLTKEKESGWTQGEKRENKIKALSLLSQAILQNNLDKKVFLDIQSIKNVFQSAFYEKGEVEKLYLRAKSLTLNSDDAILETNPSIKNTQKHLQIALDFKKIIITQLMQPQKNQKELLKFQHQTASYIENAHFLSEQGLLKIQQLISRFSKNSPDNLFQNLLQEILFLRSYCQHQKITANDLFEKVHAPLQEENFYLAFRHKHHAPDEKDEKIDMAAETMPPQKINGHALH